MHLKILPWETLPLKINSCEDKDIPFVSQGFAFYSLEKEKYRKLEHFKYNTLPVSDSQCNSWPFWSPRTLAFHYCYS
jgi:hypothetical protein